MIGRCPRNSNHVDLNAKYSKCFIRKNAYLLSLIIEQFPRCITIKIKKQAIEVTLSFKDYYTRTV